MSTPQTTLAYWLRRWIRITATVLVVPWAMINSAAAMRPPEPAELPAKQATQFNATCKSLAAAFLDDDVDAFLELCIPQDLLVEVVNPKLLERGPEALHKKMLEGNARRFAEFRARFADLRGFDFVAAESGYRLETADAFADPELILKNSYITLSYANRLILKIKIEDMVFIGGRYYIIALD